jgi:hypothetical protein
MDVVHDVMAYVDRRAVHIQRPPHDRDGPLNTGAEAERFGEKNATPGAVD